MCNGWIAERTAIVEASSRSTAISEAYFARFLGLPFIAVTPSNMSPEKIALTAIPASQPCSPMTFFELVRLDR